MRNFICVFIVVLLIVVISVCFKVSQVKKIRLSDYGYQNPPVKLIGADVDGFNGVIIKYEFETVADIKNWIDVFSVSFNSDLPIRDGRYFQSRVNSGIEKNGYYLLHDEYEYVNNINIKITVHSGSGGSVGNDYMVKIRIDIL